MHNCHSTVNAEARSKVENIIKAEISLGNDTEVYHKTKIVLFRHQTKYMDRISEKRLNSQYSEIMHAKISS